MVGRMEQQQHKTGLDGGLGRTSLIAARVVAMAFMSVLGGGI